MAPINSKAFTPKRIKKNDKVSWVVDLRAFQFGRNFFASKAQAESFSKSKLEEFQKNGLRFEVTRADIEELSTYRRRLAPLGKTIADAVEFLIANYRPVILKPLQEAVDECITAKTRTGKSERYLKKFEDVLKTFIKANPGKSVSELTRKNIEDWVFTGQRSPATLRSYLIDVRTFFNWCVLQNYCLRSPAADVEKIIADPRPPGILTADQCEDHLGKLQSLAEYSRRADSVHRVAKEV